MDDIFGIEMTHEEAMDILTQQSGTNPVLDLFLERAKRFPTIEEYIALNYGGELPDIIEDAGEVAVMVALQSVRRQNGT